MKELRPNLQRSKRPASFGSLIAATGMLLFTLIPIHAGIVPTPPKWLPPEMQAISLCRAGMNQESSDPQRALNTLRQARMASTAAIANGGGGNWVVLHNDQVIARALMMAEADAARAPQITKSPETQQSARTITSRPAANHILLTVKRR